MVEANTLVKGQVFNWNGTVYYTEEEHYDNDSTYLSVREIGRPENPNPEIAIFKGFEGFRTNSGIERFNGYAEVTLVTEIRILLPSKA